MSNLDAQMAKRKTHGSMHMDDFDYYPKQKQTTVYFV